MKNNKMWLGDKMFNLGDKGCWNFGEDHSWYKMNKDKEIPEILIYDVIGDPWDGVTAKQFIQELNEIESDTIVVRINSPGGLVYDGIAIYNALRQFKGTVITRNDAVAASIAGIIFLGGDKRETPQSADVMVHKPWSFAMGDADDMRAEADELDRVQNNLENIIAKTTGMELNAVSEMMNATTWIDGVQAVEQGFATDLLEDAKIAACVFDLNTLPGVPDRHVKMANAAKKRQEEEALREEGVSKRDAKAQVSHTASRDDGTEAATQKFIELLNQIGG